MSSDDAAAARPSRGGDTGAAVAVLLGGAIVLAAWDVTHTILYSRDAVLSALPGLWSALAVSLLASLAACAVLWFAVALPLRLLAGTPAPRLSGAIIAGLAMPYLLTQVGVVGSPPWGPPALAAMALAGAAAGLVAYRAGRFLDAPAHERPRPRAFAAAAPFVVLGAMLYVWLRSYRLDGPTPSGWLAGLLFLAAVAGTLRAFRWQALRRRTPALLLLAAAALLALGPYETLAVRRVRPLGGPGGRGHRVERVILLTIDTLRRDGLRSYDPGATPTPHLDRLAADGVRFQNAYSNAPWTLPSVMSVLTGLSPAAHGVSRASSTLPDSIPTLGDLFHDAGYRAGAVGGNPVLAGNAELRRRFQDYRFGGHRHPPTLALRLLDSLLEAGLPDRFSTDDITEVADAWIRANRRQDFFLWVHYLDPHDPYRPPAKLLGGETGPPGLGRDFEVPLREVLRGDVTYEPAERAWIEKLYRAEVQHVDDRVGRLLATLDELGLYDDTLIVVTSDHGEEFFEHGALEHGHSFYGELLAVPLLVKPPAAVPVERRLPSEPVTIDRIVPTLLDLCGVEHPTSVLSGSSLAPLWAADGAQAEPGPVFASSLLHPGRNHQEAVLHDGWKYIRHAGGAGGELYDLREDPREQVDRAQEQPERVEMLRRLLADHHERSRVLREVYESGGSRREGLTDDFRRQLKALGYL